MTRASEAGDDGDLTAQFDARSDGGSLGGPIGFIGLGNMGEPMALNLLRAGVALTTWNRSADALQRVREAGGIAAADPADVFARCDLVILMLANEGAIDAVLGRRTPEFARLVSGVTVVHMGTTSPAFSDALGADVRGAGGRYVEAPVSGSRVPAEQGALVAMLAGDPVDVARVETIVRPLCRRTFVCGAVPGAIRMKLAVNLFLITMVTGLVEATHLARASGLDLALFKEVLDAGPMASDVSRVKLGKLVAGDLSPQASLADVLMNSRLVFGAAREARAATPLLDASRDLFETADALGLGQTDMVGVLGSFEELTSGLRVDGTGG